MLRWRMRNFQGIIFIWTRSDREIFKSTFKVHQRFLWRLGPPYECLMYFQLDRVVGNKAKGRNSKRVFQENKAREIFRKTNISYPLITDGVCLKYYHRKCIKDDFFFWFCFVYYSVCSFEILFFKYMYCQYKVLYCQYKVLYFSPRIQSDTKAVYLVVIYLWIF